jgi:heme exporter protein C
MWIPLLLSVLGFYALFIWSVLQSTRVVVLERERRTAWVQNFVAEQGSKA